jgi:hypothetical protein
MDDFRCQMQEKDRIHVGRPQPVLLSPRTRLILTLSRHLDPRLKHFIKTRLKLFTVSRAQRNYPDAASSGTGVKPAGPPFKKGDRVRVRSIQEIRATLNSKDWLKGCKFMPEMEQYCDTVQRIFQPVERFLEESDYTIRKTKGLVLLENIYCQGVAGAGRCDRSCFYFWRVEWLEDLGPADEL